MAYIVDKQVYNMVRGAATLAVLGGNLDPQ